MLSIVAEVVIPEWTLGDRLAKARKGAGIKQQDLADYLGVSIGSISGWENDERQPRIGMVRQWAIRCSVPFEWLRFGHESPLVAGGSVTDESWSACTRWPVEIQDELPFGETIEPPPDTVVVPFRRDRREVA